MINRGYIAPPAPPEDLIFSEAILWAGDLVVGRAPIRMSTVLGSCVSVCLYDRQHQFGGMNHFLVPRGSDTASHGEWATTRLVERMRQLGSDIAELQGKIFGGGSPLKLVNETYAVGEENVKVARQVLTGFSIPIVAERVGHGAGVRLFFENWTGVVWLRPHEPKVAK
jgi:chemotaxis protein CheD